MESNFCLNLTFILFLTIFIENASLSNVNSSSNKTNSSISTLPPLIFPDETSNFTIVPPNEDAIKKLRHLSWKTTVAPAEITKIISSEQGVSIFRVKNMEIENIPEVFPSDLETVQNNLKDQVEEIQSDDLSKTDTGLEEQFGRQQASASGVQELFAEDIEVRGIDFNNHHLAITLATLLGIICLALYIALATWRSYLHRRYGMRELLVTQDDYYQNNDIRPFNV